MCDVHHISAVR